MKGLRIAAIAAALLFSTPALAQTARSLPPVEAFGSLPFITNVELSPDGKYFAAIQSIDGRPAGIVYKLFAGKDDAPRIFMDKDPDIVVTGITWVKNDILVVSTESNRRWYSRSAVYLDGIDGRDPIPLDTRVTHTHVIDKDLDDPDHIYVPGSTDRRDSVDVLMVNVHDGRNSVAEQGRELMTRWVMDGHGVVAARVDRLHDPLTDELLLRNANGTWQDSLKFDARGDAGADVMGVSQDGKSIVVIGQGERKTLDLIDRATGKSAGTLYANPRYDVGAALEDEWTGRIVGAEYFDDNAHYSYFDPAQEATQQGVDAAFPDTEAEIVSRSRDASRVIVLSSSPRKPPTYYFLDRTTHQASKIASQFPSLTPDDLGTMHAYPYAARDGLEISAYITYPPGREGAKNLPVVVLPHSVPDSRDYLTYDWLAEFFVNRGYAVFQPNYRGSYGFGKAFTDAGLHQWGLKIQDDVTDGVKKLISDGVADPKRICIVGNSYGGYIALAGATFTPELYACAASMGAPTDLPDLLIHMGASFGDIDTSHASFWISRIGDLGSDSEQLAATSPALHADKVKAPILLMHAENDSTVPLEQAEEERDALLKAGKSVELVTFPKDDHYFRFAATRIGILTELEKFLRDHIGS